MIFVKRSKNYEKAIKQAYAMLVQYRKNLEERGNEECAAEVEEAYKQLWCEALNEKAPWR
jgi:hypothetical protein